MLKKILIGIVILLVVVMMTMVMILKSVNKPKTVKVKVMQGKGESPKKALIVFQPSITNITSAMANSIAKGLNEEGYEVTINCPGNNLSSDISKYSVVVFGSPVYVGSPLTIVTDYMAKIKDFSSKKIVLFSTGGDNSKNGELDIMEKSLNGAKPYKKVKFISSNKIDSENKAYNLGKELSKE